MPAEEAEQATSPKASELPYMEVPPIEERVPVDGLVGAVKEKETRYKLKAAVEDEEGA